MKRVLCMLFALAVLSALCLPAFAETAAVIDEAGLLTGEEQNRLEATLDRVSREHEIDMVILTVDSLDGNTAERYAIDYYDARYGDDGVLLLVAMEEREWHFVTAGKCDTRISDSTFDDSTFTDLLSSGDYYAAFTEFADTCDSKMSSFVFIVALCGLGIGALAGLIVVLVMKSKMKSVRPQSGADQYADKNRLQLTHQSDIFLYQTVTRRPKPQQTGGGGRTGSSGRSYGGGGGRF